jgi:hypothetical protein
MSTTEVEALQQIVEVMETLEDRAQERTAVWLMHRYTDFIDDDDE